MANKAASWASEVASSGNEAILRASDPPSWVYEAVLKDMEHLFNRNETVTKCYWTALEAKGLINI